MKARRVVWWALMTFSVIVVAFYTVALFIVDHQNISITLLDIAVYMLAIWMGWKKRRNWI